MRIGAVLSLVAAAALVACGGDIPAPKALVALTRPPCRVTIAFTMDKPSPLPRAAMPLADDVL